jgi:putative transcriptional regulator
MKNKRLIELREKLGLTQEELGQKVGLTQSMIAHIEAGRREPRSKYKIRLAKFFNVSVEWLFYEQYNDHQSLKSDTASA